MNHNRNVDPGIIERARESFASVEAFAPEGRGNEPETLVISPTALREAMVIHQAKTAPHSVGVKRPSIVGDRHERIRGHR